MSQNLKSIILNLIIFLFPLFFLPFTQEFFITNKLYLLALSAMLLLLISAVELLVSKKLVLPKKISQLTPLLFVLSVILSIAIGSPNKIQAALNPNLGIVSIASLFIIFFYLQRSNVDIVKLLSASSLILSLLAIINFFQPNPLLLPIGTQLDLAIFLGFSVTAQITQIFLKKSAKPMFLSAGSVCFTLIGLFITINSLLKIGIGDLPPFRYSWYAAVEILKNPLTALFGVGVDNYSSIFTKVKDVLYNQSKIWQIASFNVGRSALLHITTEGGILTAAAFLLLLLGLFKHALKTNRLNLLPLAYLVVIFSFFPASLPLFFLFFVVISKEQVTPILIGGRIWRLGLIIIILFFVLSTGYLLGRSYLAEFFFKKSIDGLAVNNAKQLYDNQRQAVVLNPYIERFRINFSQTNLIIANNLASRTNPQPPQIPKSPQLTSQDQATIAQAIQAAISEAKAAVTLNSQRATNWENLALVYQNILNTAQGADSWTISAYQRAILLDQQNPKYRLNLGSVYYSLGNYAEAVRYFEQAAALKPDWSNAHYNLAWALYQKGEYEKAVQSMQTTISLLDKSKDAIDLKRAKKDLEEFKKKLPQK